MLEKIVTEVSLIQTLINEKPVLKYVVVLGKDNSNARGALKSTQNMGKGLHKVFKTVVKDISQNLPPLGESGSEFSRYIPEPRNFSEVTKLSAEIKKPWIKATLKEIQNLINNQNFLVQQPEKDDPVTPCMDV